MNDVSDFYNSIRYGLQFSITLVNASSLFIAKVNHNTTYHNLMCNNDYRVIILNMDRFEKLFHSMINIIITFPSGAF